MNPMRDLPMGFGMALLQDPQALQRFQSMSHGQQQEVLQHTHSIQSKPEMQAFVASLRGGV